MDVAVESTPVLAVALVVAVVAVSALIRSYHKRKSLQNTILTEESSQSPLSNSITVKQSSKRALLYLRTRSHAIAQRNGIINQ